MRCRGPGVDILQVGQRRGNIYRIAVVCPGSSIKPGCSIGSGSLSGAFGCGLFRCANNRASYSDTF